MDPAIPSQEVWLGYDLDVCRAKQVGQFSTGQLWHSEKALKTSYFHG